MRPDISFELNDKNQLTVTIDTERLHMKSVVESDFTHYSKLLDNPKNMEKFATGQALDANKVQERMNTWIKRWHTNDPFSSLAISKNDEETFIGHVVLGHGDKPGESEMAYVIDYTHWGKGYGKESVTTVVKDYAPELVSRGYKVEGKEFTTIAATSRIDNEASTKILKAAGMKPKEETTFKFGHERYTFFVNTAELVKEKRLQAEKASEQQPVAEFSHK